MAFKSCVNLVSMLTKKERKKTKTTEIRNTLESLVLSVKEIVDSISIDRSIDRSISRSIKKIYIIFTEGVASALAGHVDPLSWLNWKLEMLVFVTRGKLEKNPRSKVRNKVNPHMATSRNQTRATLLGRSSAFITAPSLFT